VGTIEFRRKAADIFHVSAAFLISTQWFDVAIEIISQKQQIAIDGCAVAP
jgi:hypothetical protein